MTASVLVLFGGCPKRQVTPRIVYVPAPPAATREPRSQNTQALVIEAPPPPQPVEQLPAMSSGQEAAPPRRRPVRHPAPPPAAAEHSEPAAPVPALEPSESPAQASAQRGQVIGLQRQIKRRIDLLSHSRLSGTDLRTLGGARAFLAQSVRALQDSDLQRALNLAHKAQLLVQAIEGTQ